MEWYISVLKNYAVFEGRARRKEYWMFFLFNIIVSVILGFIDGLLGTSFLGIIYALAIFVPTLALSVRRLHDTGRSGWWMLIAFIPIIGTLALFVFFILEGEESENQYGLNPKVANEGEAVA
ncbi:DUF805 domain-containing protein [Pseudoalteromonas luteoviolacea]|uniref:DUF805 domain-containing protein n=1 Tax=Pseudoalteromonas luteoviolacea H33 TaxID=1365251 RepID=A0A167DPE4_9GAMM|nr:DUF805 domain-containing protein [Pseudoalteromonas luteoviolacea]KZN49159.1 hypothetical protein N476_20180 [Pseudoalteromonas luteoviolacea H33]KZN73589.1 hypothetical protein N477_23080 [Pseudoalteromonas luteoviolacea H33-S]MBQ4875596.1 DUF805 domain-containing protein [Pseudoalteromonas luteoviolacea]MBQ4904631.1 DUF805 domain-containing protein [Pseudoalteromonas luteoviolacea]